MSEEDREYSVYDPVEVGLQHLKELGVGEIKVDFSNPDTARLLSQQLTVRLLELRETKLAIEDLRSHNDLLRDEIQELRVSNGQLTERSRFSWIEFPAGILCGIAGNLLASDKHNIYAWMLLLLGVIFFVIIRLPQIMRRTNVSDKKRSSDGQD